MTQNIHDVELRLAALKAAFDNSFALPPAEPQHGWAEFLLIAVAGQAYAVRIRELSAVAVDRKIISVPVDAPGLLGLCAVGGQLVPVFDLAAILGAAGHRERPPRWMALYRDKDMIGLAFDEFQGSRRLAAQDVHTLEAAAGRAHLRPQAIKVDSRLVHVLDIASVALSIRQAAHPR